jgi:ubiquinone/menaquinone biosynthesis C-methylase UbiE
MAAMSAASSPETGPDRVSRYTLDGGDEDLRRLVRIAELMSDAARTALRRVDIQAGWRAIECGCGPVGALPVLAEMVGPTGQVVGVDFNESAVGQAQEVIGGLALDNVEVVLGDVDRLDGAGLGGEFDLAYTRCFLMHQPDLTATLSRIAALIRPGGWSAKSRSERPPQALPRISAPSENTGACYTKSRSTPASRRAPSSG